MDVTIDNLELIKRIDDPDKHTIKEIRAVKNIRLDARRKLVELKIPGADASIIQDLGRRPMLVRFSGEMQGEDAKTTMENLRAKFNSGKPLSFSSDLSGIADVTQVLIEDLSIDESMGATNRYGYELTIREYVEPKEEEEAPPDQEDEAEETVEDETDDAVSTVNYVTGKVVDDNGDPKPNVKVKVTDEDGNEYETTTNEDGVYRKDDLEPGKYKVRVDEPGYEEKEQEVEVKSSGGEEGGSEEEGEETEE